MKLPISLLVLAALGHAASTQSADKGEKSSGTESSDAKGSDAKAFDVKSLQEKDTNQTSKRELYEGNFGDRKGELISNYGVTQAPKIEYAEDLKEVLPDQSPAHQIFGARLPQIAKISDVLTGQAPFEMAVANHLYAPVSIYQARLSSPISYEVPAPAASQVAYPKAYQPRKLTEDDQKLQELPINEAQQAQINFNNVPVFAVKQPRFRFDSYPRPFSPGFPRQQSSLPQDIFRQPQQFSRTPVSQLFPLYDELGPNRYPGHVVPSQFLQQQEIYQLVPIDPGYDYVNQDENRGQGGHLNQETREELKAEPMETPKVQNEYQQQGYHSHPNGAISFASFSRSLPSNTQHETTSQPQPENRSQQSRIEQQIVELPSQHHPAPEQHLQKQNFVPVKQKLHYPAIFQQYVQQLQNLHPGLQPEPQFITIQQPIRNQPRTFNSLQQRLHFEGPRQISIPQTIPFQRLPAFKPLPQSQLTSESLYQATSAAPISHESVPHFRPLLEPKSIGYHGLSTQNPLQIDQPLASISPQRHFTPLPPLKPNYSPSVKPLNSHTRISPAFLPTPLEVLPTATPTKQPVPDQLISSTTIHPDIKDKQEHKAPSIHTETQYQSQISQPLEPEITHQSQSTLLPLSIQSTTLQPFATYEAQSEHQHSTPQPEYLSTIHPQSVETSPRHEVIIQQQEVQELILEPSPQPSSTPDYQPQQQQIQDHEQQEAYQLQSQQHQRALEQLQHLQYQQVLQDSHQQKVRELQSLQHQHAQQIQSQQYQNQYLVPPHHLFQPQQLQQQQHELEESREYEDGTQKIKFEQAHDTEDSDFHQNQHESQRSRQNLEPHQFQNKQHLEPQQNHLQVTTIQPAEQPQTESEAQHQTENHPEPQYKSDLQSTTEVSHEQPQKVPTPIEPERDTSDSVDPNYSPILPPIQPGLPQIYAPPQELIYQPEHGSSLGVPLFPDVQYFGKFAQSLFGGIQH